jgi:PAS domain S-box-containing protein
MRASYSETERALRVELERVQARLGELEATTAAIRSGDVDAIVVEGPNGNHVFTLQSPEDPYRVLVERMNEGAATLSADGTILFSNHRLAEMAQLPPEQLLGSSFAALLHEEQGKSLRELLLSAVEKDIRSEARFLRKNGTSLPVQFSVSLVSLRESEKVFCLVATDLSELNRVKHGLDEQAEIFELAQDAILICDMHHRIHSWNRGARDLYGWTAEEVLGKVSFELLRTVFPEPLEAIMTTLQAKKEWGRELPQVRRDQRKIVVASRWSLLRDESGDAIAILEINRDITARIEAEDKLKTASRYTRSLIEASLDPLVTISLAGKITDVNKATELVTGVAREQLINTDFSNYFTEPDRARLGYQLAFAEGTVRDFPLAIRSTSGVVTEVLYNAAVFRDQAGEVEGVFAAARDVTERNRIAVARAEAAKALHELNLELESRVEARTQELRQSEQRVRRKLESILSPEGGLEQFELADIMDLDAIQSLAEKLYKLTSLPFFLLDLEGNVLVETGWQSACRDFHRVNPDACQNCKESDRQLSSGVPAGEFKLYKCKNQMWDVVTPVVLGDRHIGNLFSGQFFFEDEETDYELFKEQAKEFGFDERDYLAALHRVPRLSREQVMTGMAFYAKLTDLLTNFGYSGIKLSRAMAETNSVNAKLADSVKELESFAYSVSHDLRAPLRHIDGFLTLLSTKTYSTLDDASKHYVDRTLLASKRMGELIDDLLQFSRIGRSEIRKMPVDLNVVIQEILRELEPEIGKRKVDWQLTPLPKVAADRAMLLQVVENLVANALKFTRGRETTKIEIGCKAELNGELVFFVRDNGAGFDMRYYDKLFQVFQRLHSEHEFEGTGIGLAIARSVVERHGGRIWAEGFIGEGATFYFSLPAPCCEGELNELAEAHLAG